MGGFAFPGDGAGNVGADAVEWVQWVAQFGFAAVVAFLLLRVLVEDVKTQMRDMTLAIGEIRVDLKASLEANQRLTAQIAAEAQRSREDVMEAIARKLQSDR